MSRNNLSSKAKFVVLTHYDSFTVHSVKEYLSHDGYDMEGPESDIWDLYIIYTDNYGIKKKEQWHWENWFCCNEDEQYTLFSTDFIFKNKIYNT